jgi:DNA processing protein
MPNFDGLLLAFWCSQKFRPPWTLYLEALHNLQSGIGIQSREFAERWMPVFPWLMTSLIKDFDQDSENLHRWEDAGIEMVTPIDARYPLLLSRIPNPPYLLYGQGDWGCLRIPSLAVVGSREPSSLSLSWMESELANFLEKNSCNIVSGGARGVDLASHRIALRKKRPTTVLFPSGLEQMYPVSWSSFGGATAVLEAGGLLLTEYAPPTLMRKNHFLERNRLIAGLACATLMIEARLRSGTLVTGRAAIEQGRPLFILPSHPFDSNSRGGLDLISEGANMIRDAEDLSLFFQAELRDQGSQLTTNWYQARQTH